MLKEVKALDKVNKQLNANYKEEGELYSKQNKLEKSIVKQLKKLYPDLFKKGCVSVRHAVGKYKLSISLAYWKTPTVNLKNK